VQELLVVCSS